MDDENWMSDELWNELFNLFSDMRLQINLKKERERVLFEFDNPWMLMGVQN